MHFSLKGLVIFKISQQILLKWRNSKQKKFSNYLIPEESNGSFKSYGCLMNSFKFIHCFLPKQSKRSFSFIGNSLFTYNNMEMVIHSKGNIKAFVCENLENAGRLGQNCTFWDLTTTKYY